jgi:hypothetical protein
VKLLRAAQAAGKPFANVAEADREYLANVWRYVRGLYFAEYTNGIQSFEEVSIVKTTLATLQVPRVASSLPPMPFAEFMETKSDSPADCRNVTVSGEYASPADPLTVGRTGGKLTLIDGYHRAALFWKFAESTRSIQAYIPAN